jgi:DNA-binding NarL/FixJ family response regulator
LDLLAGHQRCILFLAFKEARVHAFHAPPPPEASAATLSAREEEILELLCQGRLSKEIADQLAISFHTVRVHLKHIYEKLHVRSRAEAAFKFMSQNSGQKTLVKKMGSKT